MIKSMTGYGYASISKKEYSIEVEVKSLNSKYFDLNYRCTEEFGKVENEIRNLSKKILERGKVDINIKIISDQNHKIFNKEKFNRLYSEIKNLSHTSIKVKDKIIFDNVLKNIDLFTSEKKINVCNKILITQIKKSLNECLLYRKEEGKSIYKDINKYSKLISLELIKIQQIDSKRKKKKKNYLSSRIAEINNIKFDKNRLEQEVFYYLEKIDINEELVRLKNHIKLLNKTITSPKSVGKKLNFISQEIGREINTIGSKCSDFKIQKSVINMKEYLEKIKENNYNVF